MQHLDGKMERSGTVRMLRSLFIETRFVLMVLCPRHGKIIRPNILMFGDWSWLGERSDRQGAQFSTWIKKKLEQNPATCLDDVVVIEMGAGTAIPTVRRQGERLQAAGASLIRINPRESQGPPETLSIALGAKKGLQEIDKALAKV